MGNTFSFRRLGLLMSKDMQENWKKHLTLIGTLFGALVIGFLANTQSCYHRFDEKSDTWITSSLSDLNTALLVFSILTFVIAAGVIAASLMEVMGSKTKRISYLMTPASSLEKFISRFLLVTVCYVIAFFACFYLADGLRMLYVSICYSDFPVQSIDLGIMVEKLFNGKKYFILGVLWLIAAQSVFILGATFWETKTFVKTFCFAFAFSMLNVLIAYLVTEAFTPRNWYYNWDVKQDTVLYIMYAVFGIAALFNWTLAFFRFKESEVIKRW